MVAHFQSYLYVSKLYFSFSRLLALEEQYRKEKEEADLLFEQQRKVRFSIIWYVVLGMTIPASGGKAPVLEIWGMPILTQSGSTCFLHLWVK